MIIRTSYAFEYMLACVHWQNILMRLLTLQKKGVKDHLTFISIIVKTLIAYSL